MKILIWKAKHDDIHYLADTEERELAAYKEIFDIMQEQGDFECCPPEPGLERKIYKRAIKGDLKAIRDFMKLRSAADYEYETIYSYDLRDATEVSK